MPETTNKCPPYLEVHVKRAPLLLWFVSVSALSDTLMGVG
jgi:hypothetical protein